METITIQAMLTEEEFREHIRAAVNGHGSQKALADDMHITPAYLSDILSGKRAISDVVAQYFGRKRVMLYVVPVDGQEAQAEA